MKKIIIILYFFTFQVNGQNLYNCVPDSLIMNWLNVQNSYHFRMEAEIMVSHFGYENRSGDDRPEYLYISNCLSTMAKAKILSLLKGEPYDFEKELDKNKEHFTNPKSSWVQNRLEFNFKGDTARLAEKLDSLYQPIRAEQLTSKQAEEYSEELILFVGLIYLFDAIPILKAELQAPTRFADYSKQELIKETLARFGDKYWLNYYLKDLARLPEDWHEMNYKLRTVKYINNSSCYKKYYRLALSNKKPLTFRISSGPVTKIGWNWAIDDLIIGTIEFEKLQRKKFGKTINELEQSGKNIYTEKIRKGLLEILETCKYDCLVDYSQKPRKKNNKNLQRTI